MKVDDFDIQTVRGLEKLPPRHAPYYKNVAKGLAVGHFHPGTGTLSWIARFRHERVYYVETLENCDSYQKAVKYASAYAERALSGEVTRGKKRKKKEKTEAKAELTVEELIYEYLTSETMQSAKGERYGEWYDTGERLSKRYVFRFIGEQKINTLEDDDLRGLQIALLKEVAPATVTGV